MSLEDLIAKIKENQKEEKELLEKEHKKIMEEIDEKWRKELQHLEEKLQREREREKERIILSNERKKSFDLKMERLSLKKKLTKEAKDEIMEDLKNLPFESRKKIIVNELKGVKNFIDESSKIIIPKGEKKEAVEILKEIDVKRDLVEEKVDFTNGFLFAGERWSFEVTLKSILEKESTRKDFAKNLFGDL